MGSNCRVNIGDFYLLKGTFFFLSPLSLKVLSSSQTSYQMPSISYPVRGTEKWAAWFRGQTTYSVIEQKDKSFTCSRTQHPYSIKSPVIILCMHPVWYTIIAIWFSLYLIQYLYQPSKGGMAVCLNSVNTLIHGCLVCSMYCSRCHCSSHFMIISSQEGDVMGFILRKLKPRDTKYLAQGKQL